MSDRELCGYNSNDLYKSQLNTPASSGFVPVDLGPVATTTTWLAIGFELARYRWSKYGRVTSIPPRRISMSRAPGIYGEIHLLLRIVVPGSAGKYARLDHPSPRHRWRGRRASFSRIIRSMRRNGS